MYIEEFFICQKTCGSNLTGLEFEIELKNKCTFILGVEKSDKSRFFNFLKLKVEDKTYLIFGLGSLSEYNTMEILKHLEKFNLIKEVFEELEKLGFSCCDYDEPGVEKRIKTRHGLGL